MEPSDQELIRAIQAGRAEAFDALYHRYRDWVAALAYRFTGHREDALDVLQETFAYVVRKLPRLDLRAKFKTFLYPVVKHLAVARRGARREVPLATEPSVGPGAPGEAEALLAGLPDEQREVVWMRIVDELSLAEIAEALGVPVGTVKSRLHAALEKLRLNPPG